LIGWEAGSVVNGAGRARATSEILRSAQDDLRCCSGERQRIFVFDGTANKLSAVLKTLWLCGPGAQRAAPLHEVACAMRLGLAYCGRGKPRPYMERQRLAEWWRGTEKRRWGWASAVSLEL